jgi:CRISPR-associated protein Csm1
MTSEVTQALEQLQAARELALRANPSRRLALVAGDVSGIQKFLAQAAARGTDGAARRLRYRSFFIEALAHVASRRLFAEAGERASEQSLLLDAGGHFLALVPADVLEHLPALRTALDEECRRLTEGVVRMHWSWQSFGAAEDMDAHVAAVQQGLRRDKQAPLASVLTRDGRWEEARFRLEGEGGEPCATCRLPRAAQPGAMCRFCRRERELGGDLGEESRWYFGPHVPGGLRLAGWGVRVHSPAHPLPSGAWQGRPLPSHVPPGEFEDIAAKAPGRSLLAYVKADGDRIGTLFQGCDLPKLMAMSRRINRFFEGFFEQHLSQPEDRETFYLVYGGGDDLFFVAPWDRAIQLSIAISGLWSSHLQEYASTRSTLSCGIAIHHRRFPIASALASAEDALLGAKRCRDRLMLLGEELTWEQAAQVSAQWEELHRQVREERLPVSALRQMMAHLPPSPEPCSDQEDPIAIGLEPYLRGRALLLYALYRNAPRREHPRFWEWARHWLTFDAIPDGQRATWAGRLQVLRVAVPLALWSLRGQERGDAEGEGSS